MSGLFNDLELAAAGEGQNQPIKPLCTIEYKKDEVAHKWLMNAYRILIEEAKPRTEQQKENMRLYRGALLGKAKSSSNDRLLNDVDPYQQRIKDQKLYINYLYDLTETKVNKLMSSKPAISVFPATNEFEDRIAADVAKSVLDTIWYERNFEDFLRRLERATAICGEAYMLPFFNPDLGDLHPEYIKLRDAGEEIPDNIPSRVGDVDYKIYLPWRVLNERAEHYDLCNWQILIDYEDIDLLKKRYKSKADKIKETGEQVLGYDDSQIKELKINNKVVVFKFLHKPTRELPKGRQIISTMDVVLSNDDFPFNHEQLCIRLTDIDSDDQLNAQSNYQNVKGIQFQHYNLSTMIIANQRLMAYPKWLVPQGTINTQSLGNDRTIVQYKGQVAPSLLTASPTPGEVFKFRDELKEEMRQMFGTTPTDRGQPPPGVTAGVALQYLGEQEAERYNTASAKHNEVIVKAAKQSLSIAGDYYDQTDGRMVRILGKNKQYNSELYDLSNLNRPYDIRITNASSLPEGKAARTQTIIDLNREVEGLFTKEQVVDLLDLADTEKFNDIATSSLRAAESIYQDLVQGKPVGQPEPWENLILHWRVIVLNMQERSFKEKIAQEGQQAVLDYLMALEMLMTEKAAENQAFAQNLLTLELFPILFTQPKMPVQPPVMEDPQAQGAPLPPPEEQVMGDELGLPMEDQEPELL